MLYLMGYPKPKSVSAFETHANNKLFHRNDGDKTTEDFLKVFITFDNDTSLYIKCGGNLISPKTGHYCELNGEKAGIIVETFSKENPVKIVEVTDEPSLIEIIPDIPPCDPFSEQINHFIDCAMGKTECIVKVEEGVALMEIITAAYESARTGMPIIMNK